MCFGALSNYNFLCVLYTCSGGENDEDLIFDVYYLSEDDKWEHKDEMVTGITETTIHSYFAVMDIDMDDRLPNS